MAFQEVEELGRPEPADDLIARVAAAVRATTERDGWRWWEPGGPGTLAWNGATAGEECAAAWTDTEPGAVWVDLGSPDARGRAGAIVIFDTAAASPADYRCHEVDATRFGLGRADLARIAWAADLASRSVAALRLA